MLSAKMRVFSSLTLFSTCHALTLDFSKVLLESYTHDYHFETPGKSQPVQFTRALPLAFYIKYRCPVAQNFLQKNNLTNINLYVGVYWFIYSQAPIFGKPDTKDSTQTKVDNINNFYLTRMFSPRSLGFLLAVKLYNKVSVEYQFSRALTLSQDKQNAGLALLQSFFDRPEFYGRLVYLAGAKGNYTALVRSDALVVAYHINKRFAISCRIQHDGFIRKRSPFFKPEQRQEQEGLIRSCSLQLDYSLNFKEL